MINWKVMPTNDIVDFIDGDVSLKGLREKFWTKPVIKQQVYNMERLGVKRAKNAARKALKRRTK